MCETYLLWWDVFEFLFASCLRIRVRFHVDGRGFWRPGKIVFCGGTSDLDLAVVKVDLLLPSFVDLERCLDPEARSQLREGMTVWSLGFGVGGGWNGESEGGTN
mgnify:CR=1 FL=1